MSTADRPRRFIAGAVCPRCNALDRIVVFEVDGRTHRECVRCGFADTLDRRGNPTAGTPRGRLDTARRGAPADVPAEPVRIRPLEAGQERGEAEDDDGNPGG